MADDHHQRRDREQQAETGRGNLGSTIKNIITGAGIGGSIAAARVLTEPETTASGQPMPQDTGGGWNR